MQVPKKYISVEASVTNNGYSFKSPTVPGFEYAPARLGTLDQPDYDFEIHYNTDLHVMCRSRH